MSSLTHRARAVPAVTDVLAVAALAMPWIVAALLPSLSQPQSYHQFADQRTLLGVPHALNVLSNVAFLLVGVIGLAEVQRARRAAPTGQSPSALPYAMFFGGTLLTALGSAWYHADPNDATLTWDRLPIAVGFAGLLAATLADRAPARSAAYTMALGVSAVAAVGAWVATGNLLPYVVMQVGFVATALTATFALPSRFTLGRWLYSTAALYALAVVFEHFDRRLYAAFGETVSGHTLKHLVAAAAVAIIVVMLRRRQSVAD